jgi:hypothetical protein
MPIPKNWSEELIAEWLEIDGFLVVSGFPVASKGGGGRGDLDVLGVRVENQTLVIRHVEIGELNVSSSAGEEKLKMKFSDAREKEITNYPVNRIGLKGYKIEYRPLFIPTSFTGKKYARALRLEVGARYHS